MGVSPAQLSEDFFLSPQFSRSRASVTPRFASLDLSRMPAFGWRGRQEAGIRELRCVGLACGSGGEASSGLLADFACCLCLLLAPRALVRCPRACVRGLLLLLRGAAWRGVGALVWAAGSRLDQGKQAPVQNRALFGESLEATPSLSLGLEFSLRRRAVSSSLSTLG